MAKIISISICFLLFPMASSSYILSITTASKCAACPAWMEWMTTIEQERPWMTVHHYDFFEDFNLLDTLDVLPVQSLSVPTAFYIDDNKQAHQFQYGRSLSFVRRWMEDVDFGFLELVPQIAPHDGFEEQHRIFMQIISKERPKSMSPMNLLPSIGFGWFPLTPPDNYTGNLFNTTIVKGLDGVVSGQHELPIEAGLLRRFLPPITAYFQLDKTMQNTVNEILSALATEEVHFISDTPLPSWWLSIASNFTDVGFVHRNSTESGLESPSTRTFLRTMEFVTPTVSNRTWLTAVRSGLVAPVSRPSSLPSTTTPHVTELSGDTLNTWLLSHPNGVLYFYTDTTQSCQSANTGTGFGRMHLPHNDHELFLSAPTPNTAVRFSSGLPTTTTECTDWEDKQEL